MMMYLGDFSALMVFVNIAFGNIQAEGEDRNLEMITEKSSRQSINLYYDLYVPERSSDRPAPLVIALHGYEGNKESMMALARRVNSEDFIVASLQAPNGFFVQTGDGKTLPRIGFGWMMQYKAQETISLHHRAVLSIIEETAGLHPVDRNAIFLLAFSQSVALNYRFAFTHPNLIRGIVAVCGGIPGDWNEEKYHESRTDVLIVAGETDDIYPAERSRSFKEMLARRAGAVDYLSFPVGHVFPRESLPIINEWLLARVDNS
jgi:predicted esterase